MIQINGLELDRDDGIQILVGDLITCSYNWICKHFLFDYFLLMTPPEMFWLIITITNRNIYKEK